MAASANTLLEVFATGASLIYIVLLIRERVSCWPFGIAGSLLSIYLFIDTRLYSEAILYAFYVGMGVWGWVRWSARDRTSSHPVVRLSATGNAALITLSLAFGLTLGQLLAVFTDAERPLIDAMTTSFSFAATFLQVRKALDAWIYWMLINLTTIWFYQDRELVIYATLMVIYTVLSVVGFVRWLRTYLSQQAAKPSPTANPASSFRRPTQSRATRQPRSANQPRCSAKKARVRWRARSALAASWLAR